MAVKPTRCRCSLNFDTYQNSQRHRAVLPAVARLSLTSSLYAYGCTLLLLEYFSDGEDKSNAVMRVDNGRTNHQHRYQLRPVAASIDPRETACKCQYLTLS